MKSSVALALLGKNVRAWRERRAMTCTSLAVACGLTAGEMEALERGEFEVCLDDLQAISDLLEVRIADLFSPVDEHQSPSMVEIRAV